MKSDAIFYFHLWVDTHCWPPTLSQYVWARQQHDLFLEED